MPHKRNNAKADAMYALYRSGHSLAQVALAFGVTRQNVYKIFALRDFAMRTTQPLPFILWGGDKFTRRANGYFATTRHGRAFLHRKVWESANGEIPEGYDVHHKDGNKENNTIDNLEILTRSAHGKKHGFAGNQFVPSIGYRPVRE